MTFQEDLLMQLGNYTMKPIDRGLLSRYILTNFAISSLIALAVWYTGGFIKGVLSKIGLILFTPGFIMLMIFQVLFQGKGASEAMDDYSYEALLVVSFIFYSAVIALIQLIFYKWKKKKEARQRAE